VSTALGLLAAVLGVAVAALSGTAFVAGARAVAIGGARLLVNGHEWFAPSERVPQAARPHMPRALWRWLGAMGCLLLAGAAAGLVEASR
jgi:hypothetical protein